MRTIPNRQLTTNFSLYEFIEASPDNNQEFIAMNWANINEFNEANAMQLATFLQRLRTIINQRYKSDTGASAIGIRITSAFRCRDWDISRGRSGIGAHPLTSGVDIQPTNVSLALGARILAELHKEYKPLKTGHQGGLGLKKPTRNTSRVVTAMGFLHFDLLRRRRWDYP